jgi:Mtf2 family
MVSNQVAQRFESLQYPIFLYCTRTILQDHTRLKRIFQPATFSTAPRTSGKSDKVSKHENGQDEPANFFREKAKRSRGQNAQFHKIRPSVSLSLEDKTSTITGRERTVFKKIFNDIATGPAAEKSKAASPQEHKMTSPVDYRRIFSIFSNAPFEDMSGSDKNAAPTASDIQQEHTVGGSSNKNPTLSDQDREQIQKYPERLRKIASRATLFAKTETPYGIADGGRLSPRTSQNNHQLEDYATPRTDFSAAESEFSEASAVQKSAIDSICTAQMKRISEILIQAAQVNDKKLWTACKISVFPLLAYLKETPSRSSTLVTSKPSPSKDVTVSRQRQDQQYLSPTPKAATAESNTTTHRLGKESPAKEAQVQQFPREPTTSDRNPRPPFHIPTTIPSLPIISTLYPALLLLLLRLLTTHYPLSSYSSTLLPRIRELGLRSYVLGTSTQLYNTLLAHRWDMYSDLQSMDALLQEMEQGGIDFNAETVQVLERVRTEKMEDELAEKNAAEERKRQQSMLKTTSQKQKKERQKAKMVAMSVGEMEGASAGKRARSWWAAELTAKWVERVVGAGGWRGRVMERLRQKRDAGGEEKGEVDEEEEEEVVVEREYADSAGGAEHENGPNKQSVAVWL